MRFSKSGNKFIFNLFLVSFMVDRKGDCGGTPRVGKRGDPKGRGLGRNRRR